MFATVVSMVCSSSHWRRFNLRSVFLLVTAFGVLFGWWASRAIRQREIVIALERLGGHVQYNDDHYFAPRRERIKQGGAYGVKVIQPPPKSWLRRMLGDDWFATVYRVNMRGDGVTNEDIKTAAPLLAELPQFDRLDLDYASIDGAGLQPLGVVKQLRFLTLYDTGVSIDDPHVVELRRHLPHLQIAY